MSQHTEKSAALHSDAVDGWADMETGLPATTSVDDDDSDTCERSSYLDIDRMSASPRTDHLSVDSSSPKSDCRAKWNEVPEVVLCCWCKNVCNQVESLVDSSTKAILSLDDRQFCSEVCFNLCRRASFKKSKMCDWCQQVQPTVSYVDFTDGNHQLQFCGDACLNQYKMHIFCRETEVHLQLMPHINDLQSHDSQKLITPELWLKNSARTILKAEETSAATSDTRQNTTHSSQSLKMNNESSISRTPPPVLSPSSVSAINYDANQPMNLSTQRRIRQNSGNNEKNSSKCNKQNKSHAGLNTDIDGKSFQKTFDKTDSHTNEDSLNHRASIRVRRLDDNSRSEERHLPNEMTPLSHPPNLSPLSNMLLGARTHFMNSMGAMAASDITTPPILQQLLLSNANLFRMQAIRPPLMLPSHHPIPSHDSATMFPPSTPRPSIHPHASNIPFNGPPVAVMVPVPFPIPIPLPVPIPVPILDMEKVKSSESQSKSSAQAVLSLGQPQNKVVVGERTHSPNNSLTSQPLKTQAQKVKTLWPPIQSPIQSPILSQHLLKKDSSICEAPVRESAEKGRRSILKYTSDVYDINGEAMPGDSHVQPLSVSCETSTESSKTSLPCDKLLPVKRRKRKFVIPQSDSQPKRKNLVA